MRLRSNESPKALSRIAHSRTGARMLGAAAILGGLGVTFVAGALAYRGGYFGACKRYLLERTPTPTPQCPLVTVDVPELNIMLSAKAYQQLADRREEFLQGGLVMVHEKDDYVTAHFQYSGVDAPVKGQVRLTGNMVDRIRDPIKWSFRVKLKEPFRILGMREFNVHPPWARDYMSEWYYMRALRREGLIGARYTFVRVRLNGRDLGIYGLEEHPGPPLLENNDRAPAPILRFEQNTFWQEWSTFGDEVVTSGGTGSGSFHASEVRPYDRKLMVESVVAAYYGIGTARTDLADGMAEATALLEAFRRGTLPTHEVFDVALTARFFALTDVMGAWHTLNWNMMRFYYNPITGYLEPIGLNGYNDYTGASIRTVGLLGQSIDDYVFPATHELHERFFDDLVFARAYGSELERLSDPAWLDAFFAETADDAREAYSIIYPEAPAASCSLEPFYGNAQHIREVLNPNTKGMQAYFDSFVPAASGGQGAAVRLQVANMQRLPTEMLELRYDGYALAPVEGQTLVLPGRRGAMHYVTVDFAWPADRSWSPDAHVGLTLVYHPLGTSASNRHESAVFAWPYSTVEDYAAELAALSRPNIAQFEWLQTDAEAKVIRVLPGEWTITQTLAIPAGYEVQCGPGTRLHLRDGAGIITASALRWMGDPEAPIVLDGDGTGRGVVLLRCADPSRLEYVVLDDLQAPLVNGSPVSGAVTAFQSPTRWLGCQILRSQADTALYSVQSDIVLNQVLVQGADTGVLLERCTAVLEDVGIARIAQRGLVARTSSVAINRLTIDQIGECALAAADGSAMTLTDLLVQDSAVGVLGAGGSLVDAQTVTVHACGYGLVAHETSGGWGPGEIIVSGVTLDSNACDVLCARGSSVMIDGVAQAISEQDVEGLLRLQAQ